MEDFNRVVLVGRAVKKLHLVKADTYVSGRFVLAVNRKKRSTDGVQQTDFIPIVIWGNYAEKISTYIQKGKQLLVEGLIQVNEVDSKDDQRAWFTQVSAEKVIFIGSSVFKELEKGSES